MKRLGYLIILGTLLVSVPRYASAFQQAEPPLFGLPTAPVTGLGFGLLLELGVYFVIDSWFDARRRGLKLHWILLLGIASQLILAPVIVAPALVAHLRANGSELAGVLTWSPALWAWAIVVAAAPALLLAAVAAASYLREPATSRKRAEDAIDKPEVVPEPARKLPEWLPVEPEGKAHFVELVRNGAVVIPEDATGNDLVPVAGSSRSGRAWLLAGRTVVKDGHNGQ